MHVATMSEQSKRQSATHSSVDSVTHFSFPHLTRELAHLVFFLLGISAVLVGGAATILQFFAPDPKVRPSRIVHLISL